MAPGRAHIVKCHATSIRESEAKVFVVVGRPPFLYLLFFRGLGFRVCLFDLLDPRSTQQPQSRGFTSNPTVEGISKFAHNRRQDR